MFNGYVYVPRGKTPPAVPPQESKRRVIVINRLSGFPYYAEFKWPSSTAGLGKFSSFTFQEGSWCGGMNMCNITELSRRYQHEIRTGAIVVFDRSPRYENFQAARILSPEAIVRVLMHMST